MNELPRRPLGRTGLNVSILSLGAGPLGNVYGDIDTQTGIRAVHAALEHGINFVDTSPYYGKTLSETRLGEALKGKRDQMIVATKGGRYDLAEFDFSPARLRRSVEESLTRLQTDYIDLYQLHDIEFVLRQGIIDQSLPTLEKLRAEGKIRFIGISGYPLLLLQEVAAAFPVDTILSYCHYNLFNTTLAQQLMPFARQRGMGLINASTLHMGVLTDQGAPPWHPAPDTIHATGQKVAALARDHGTTITRLALQFALQNEHISTTLVGMATEEEVAHNVALVGNPPDETLLRAVQAIIEPLKDISWQSGRPENFEPQAVPQRSV